VEAAPEKEKVRSCNQALRPCGILELLRTGESRGVCRGAAHYASTVSYFFSGVDGAIGAAGGVVGAGAADGTAGGVVVAGAASAGGVGTGVVVTVTPLVGAVLAGFSVLVVAAVGAPLSPCGMTGGCSGVTGVVSVGTSSKTLLVLCFVAPIVKLREVNMKTMAVAEVSLVRKFPAPELPKIVWLEPPNTALTSEPLPFWSSTTMTKKMQAIT